MSDLARLTECIDQLCDPYTDGFNVSWWEGGKRRVDRKVTPHASLLNQLRELTNGGVKLGGTSRPKPGSRPPCDLSALQCTIAIADATDDWQARWGVDHKLQLEDNVRSLQALAYRLDDDALAVLARDVSSWHWKASFLCGWIDPVWIPEGIPCPLCDTVTTKRTTTTDGAGLIIRRAELTAVCRTCGATWDQNTIGILGDFIRGEKQGASS